MIITVTEPALAWFQRELDVQENDYVRFFARYGGCGTVQKGFSLGVNKETPREIGVKERIKGITFYIEKEDLWYFEDRDLTVQYNQTQDEISFVVDQQ